jgi:hypothetical protein
MNAEPNDLHKQRKDRIQNDKDFTSARISESARYVGFGLAALSMAFLTSDARLPRAIMASYGSWIIFAAALGCATIFLDYLHYWFGYQASEQAWRNVDGDFGYRTETFFYRARRWCFTGKQITATMGALCVIVVLLMSLTL